MDDETGVSRESDHANQQLAAQQFSGEIDAAARDEAWLLGADDGDPDWGVRPSPGWSDRLTDLAAMVGDTAADSLHAIRRVATGSFERVRPAIERAWAELRPSVRTVAVGVMAGLAVLLWRLRMFILRPLGNRQMRSLAVPRWRAPVVSAIPAVRWPAMRPQGHLWRMSTLTIGAAICLLLACTLPPLAAIGGALDDYHTLRALGDSGLQHLLAAKRDVEVLSLSINLSPLQQALAPTTGAAPSPVPYTYEIQRQAGTDYTMTVTVHPAPAMASAGLDTAHLQAAVDANTLLRYGAPTAATTQPATTTSPTNATARPGMVNAEEAVPPARMATLQALGNELRAAQGAFGALRGRLGAPDWILQTAGRLPSANSQLTTVAALAQTGYEIATTALALYDAAMPLLTRMRQGVLSSQGDLVTPADLDALARALADAVRVLGAIPARLGKINLRDLPLSQDQIALFAKQLAALPALRDAAQQALAWLPAVEWMLCVTQPRHFLVQTLDRTELRPSGGFTGDYGVLTLSNGRLAPFSLYNINDIEYGYKNNGYIYGRRPPNGYGWWPFSDFGLRDSNLSADFPTTAKMNMDLFKIAGQGDVDGVIQMTPTLIAHVLLVTGPIAVPGYNETITADNLEGRIQFYQQDPRGIAIEQRLNPTDHTHSLRKRFTQLVAQLLQDRVKHLGETQLLALARQLVDDLKAKNLQIYVTNAAIEGLLTKLHAGGVMESTSGTDTYMLVQANVSVAKSTPYVRVAQSDDVTLDDQGGATHRLTITLYNNPTGPIYGYPTYRDYLRIYVPATARFTGGSGFDQMTAMCYTPPPPPPPPPPAAPPASKPAPSASAAASPTAPTTPKAPTAASSPTPAKTPTPTPPPAPPSPPPAPPRPPQYAGLPDCPAFPYASSDRACPSGYYAWNGEASKVLGWDDTIVPALDRVGGPTNSASDLPGFAMRGGYVMIPRFCTARVTLRWYVPNVAHPLPAGPHKQPSDFVQS